MMLHTYTYERKNEKGKKKRMKGDGKLINIPSPVDTNYTFR